MTQSIGNVVHAIKNNVDAEIEDVVKELNDQQRKQTMLAAKLTNLFLLKLDTSDGEELEIVIRKKSIPTRTGERTDISSG